MEKVTLNVTGMTCGHCQMSVANALKGVSGVKTAEVSLEKNQAIVEFKENKTNPEEMIKAIEEAGYKAIVA
jgi:copper chaperone